MTTRQIVDAIHEGLPIHRDTDAPDKKTAGAHFARMMSGYSVMESSPQFAVSDAEKEELRAITETATNIHDLIAQSREAMAKPLWIIAQQFLQAQKQYASDTYEQMKVMHWARFEYRRPDQAEATRAFLPHAPETEWHESAMHNAIFFGTNNTLFNIYALLCCIPKLVHQTTNQIVTPDEWSRIGESTLSLLSNYSSADEEVFEEGIVWALRDKDPRPWSGRALDWPGYDPWAFRINEQGEMHLHPQIIESTRQKVQEWLAEEGNEISEERTGCPGRAAFPLIHKRVMLAAKDSLFPYADKITFLPMK